MPYANPDQTDPMALHGVALETDAAEAHRAHREMAACFVEEFSRMGFEPARILRMFQTPSFTGPFMAYEALGPEAIQSMIDEQIRLRGPRGRGAKTPPATPGDVTLEILNP